MMLPCPGLCLGAGTGGGFLVSFACCVWASRMKSLIKFMSFAITLLSTPCASSELRRACHDGSTLSEVKPFSASYPMCATWRNDPAVGPEIMDLSILPPLADFFFEDDAFVLAAREGLLLERTMMRKGCAPLLVFLCVTFLNIVFASFVSEKTSAIIQSCEWRCKRETWQSDANPVRPTAW